MQYKVKQIHISDEVERDEVEEMEDVLNELAKEGWRVIAITPCVTHCIDENDNEFCNGNELLVTLCKDSRNDETGGQSKPEHPAGNATQLVFIKGDVFQAKAFGADGLAVFYGGLSAIRVLASEHKNNSEFNAQFRRVIYGDFDFDDLGCRAKGLEGMEQVLTKVLDELAASKCRVVAMNGLRCDDRPNPHIRPEKYQIKFIKKWLASHPGVFEKIFLIDLRNGFNLANTLI